MSISEPFIRRPIGTSLLAIGLFLTGMTAYRSLPVASVLRPSVTNIRSVICQLLRSHARHDVFQSAWVRF
jgi:hypothetical protein